MQNTELTGRVILVTGAARGLGRAYAECLLREGAKVALHDGGVDPGGGAPNPAIVDAAAQELAAANVAPFAGLLNDRASCHNLVTRVLARFGRLDGVIHNAGVVVWQDTLDISEEQYSLATQINHDVAFWLSQAALQEFRKTGYGRLVLTSSAWALKGQPGSDRLTAYCLSKAAQLGLGLALSHDPTSPNIRTNVLVPVAKTRVFVRDVAPGELQPQAVAGSAAWLVSPACTITGQIIRAANGDISVLQLSELGNIPLGTAAHSPVDAGQAIMTILKTREKDLD